MAIHTENLIIGAGPAGLAMAGRLRKQGKEFIVLEQSQQVAHSWQNHYDRLHLHTVSDYSHLPHLPFPADFPQYVPRQRLVDYYESYAKEMRIEPRLGEEVVSVKKQGESWETQTAAGNTYTSRQVIVCTGFNRSVHQATWPRMLEFDGNIIYICVY